MKGAYEQGYYGSASGDIRSDNPYSPITQPIEFYAWLAGFSDYELGYNLDLTVFK